MQIVEIPLFILALKGQIKLLVLLHLSDRLLSIVLGGETKYLSDKSLLSNTTAISFRKSSRIRCITTPA